MGKNLIILFDSEEFELGDLKAMSPDKLYKTAQKGVKKGICDIYTVEDFCASINDGDDCLTTYWVLPCLVNELEYEKWWK